MNTHLQRYLTDKLTPEDLKALRQQVGAMSDSEVESEMRDDWNAFADVARDNAVIEVRTVVPLWRRAVRIAAAVLLPVFMAVSAYLYTDNRQMISQNIEVITRGGEHASVQLPDGSVVDLNSNSRLTYSAAGFASSKREVKFDGEGFFCIAKDAAHPFLVNADHLTVTVRGTAFNLEARADMNEASLYLENGKVEMQSLSTGDRTDVEPGQLAVLDYRTGHFSVSSDEISEVRMAWRSGDLVYINEPLPKVLRSLERNYNYVISLEAGGLDEAKFTGTLSATNIYDAMRILELTFDVECSGADSVLTLSN